MVINTLDTMGKLCNRLFYVCMSILDDNYRKTQG